MFSVPTEKGEPMSDLTEKEVLEWCEERNYVLVAKEAVPYVILNEIEKFKTWSQTYRNLCERRINE